MDIILMPNNGRKIFGSELQSILSASNSVLEKEYYGDLSKLKRLEVEKLQPGRFQPRKIFDDSNLQELAASIKQQGILQPLIVREVDGLYEIIVGERRWRAAKVAGLKQVPVIICSISDETAIAYGLIENVQRKELNAIEQAQSINTLINNFSLTHEQIANAIGKSRVSVTNLVRLLALPEEIQTMVMFGDLEMGHARALLALNGKDQITVAKTVAAKKLSVRETEALVNKALIERGDDKKFDNQYVEKVNDWQKRLSKHLHTNVSIKINKEGKGRVAIFFDTPSEIEWVISMLEKSTFLKIKK